MKTIKKPKAMSAIITLIEAYNNFYTNLTPIKTTVRDSGSEKYIYLHVEGFDVARTMSGMSLGLLTAVFDLTILGHDEVELVFRRD